MTRLHSSIAPAPSPARHTDASGFTVFSRGQIGEAHAYAHDMLDQNRLAEGHVGLGTWLDELDDTRPPEMCRSEWTHIQWHMAVFEIAAGQLERAHQRFERHILPVVPAGEALTDAPSLLWRLLLAGGADLDLEWGPVRDAAVESLRELSNPYVCLHNLMALAGARDVVAIDRWLDRQICTRGASCAAGNDQCLIQMAWSLRTYASRDYRAACTLLAPTLERVGRLGGSRAQNEVFFAINGAAERSSHTALVAA